MLTSAQVAQRAHIALASPPCLTSPGEVHQEPQAKHIQTKGRVYAKDDIRRAELPSSTYYDPAQIQGRRGHTSRSAEFRKSAGVISSADANYPASHDAAGQPIDYMSAAYGGPVHHRSLRVQTGLSAPITAAGTRGITQGSTADFAERTADGVELSRSVRSRAAARSHPWDHVSAKVHSDTARWTARARGELEQAGQLTASGYAGDITSPVVSRAPRLRTATRPRATAKSTGNVGASAFNAVERQRQQEVRLEHELLVSGIRTPRSAMQAPDQPWTAAFSTRASSSMDNARATLFRSARFPAAECTGTALMLPRGDTDTDAYMLATAAHGGQSKSTALLDAAAAQPRHGATTGLLDGSKPPHELAPVEHRVYPQVKLRQRLQPHLLTTFRLGSPKAATHSPQYMNPEPSYVPEASQPLRSSECTGALSLPEPRPARKRQAATILHEQQASRRISAGVPTSPRHVQSSSLRWGASASIASTPRDFFNHNRVATGPSSGAMSARLASLRAEVAELRAAVAAQQESW